MSKFINESSLKRMRKEEIIEYVLKLQKENSTIRTHNNELRVRLSFEKEDARINQQLRMF